MTTSKAAQARIAPGRVPMTIALRHQALSGSTALNAPECRYALLPRVVKVRRWRARSGGIPDAGRVLTRRQPHRPGKWARYQLKQAEA